MTMPSIPPGRAPVPATMRTEVAAVRQRLDELGRSGSIASTPCGDWTDDGANAGGTTISNGSGGGGVGVKITDIGVLIGSPVGCSLSAGTFTPTRAGRWMFTFTVQFVGGASAMRAIYLALGTASNTPGGQRYGLNSGVADAISSSTTLTLAANQPVSIYAACWTTGGSVGIWRANGNLLSATWMGL